MGEEEFIFLAAYYFYERNIAKRLGDIYINKPLWNETDQDKTIEWVEKK